MKHHFSPARMGTAALAGVLVGGSFALVAPTELTAPGSLRERLQPSAPQVVASSTLLFVGDIMLDRHIRIKRQVLGTEYLFSEIAPLLASADAVVGNLEGPITALPSVSSGTQVGDISNMRFTFPPDTAEVLRQYGFSFVSIGNNHIWDMAQSGVASTMQYLEGAGIGYVGNPYGTSGEPAYLQVGDIQVAFVSYNEFRGGDAARAIDAIARADADATVVLAHWGVEYETAPTEEQRALARRMVDAGANLIIGTHSHVVGEREVYKNAPIYYSLGNFVFDQYFEPAVRCGLVVRATIERTTEGVRIIPAEEYIEMRPTGQTIPGCSFHIADGQVAG